MVTITTNDGKGNTDPTKIKVPRNEYTERFYQMLEAFELPKSKDVAADD